MTDPVPRVKTVVHEEASRLPDTSWTWRRILIFGVITVMCLIAWRVSERVADIQTLRQVNRYAYGIICLGLLLYGIGATVTDVTRLMTAFFSTKKITLSEGNTPPPPPTQPGPSDDGELPPEQRIS